MSDNHVTVYISPYGTEISDLDDLITGAEPQIEWIGTINDQEIPVRLRLADEPEEDEA